MFARKLVFNNLTIIIVNGPIGRRTSMSEDLQSKTVCRLASRRCSDEYQTPNELWTLIRSRRRGGSSHTCCDSSVVFETVSPDMQCLCLPGIFFGCSRCFTRPCKALFDEGSSFSRLRGFSTFNICPLDRPGIRTLLQGPIGLRMPSTSCSDQCKCPCLSRQDSRSAPSSFCLL